MLFFSNRMLFFLLKSRVQYWGWEYNAANIIGSSTYQIADTLCVSDNAKNGFLAEVNFNSFMAEVPII